jgi:acyl-[acyl carrier protein]--UDP-N-acetylglucosamine O-acyltransferase
LCRIQCVIHPSAYVDPAALLGEGVEVGAFSVVGANVRVEAGTRIGSHCVIGEPSPLAEGPLVIGPRSVIRSHSVLYLGSVFGASLETGHRVTIREGTRAGENLRVGTLSDIQGDVEIGDYVRLHSNVHVGKHARIGDFVWIYPYTVLTNDPTPPSDDAHHRGVVVEDAAVITTMCCIAPGVTIGAGALVAAMSMVTKDVPPGSVARGAPAREVGPASAVQLRDGSGRSAYPWQHHFRRGYPDTVVENWDGIDDVNLDDHGDER